MKAIRIHSHGGVESLRIDEISDTAPKSHEVKIKVMASSLNHMDIWVRQGMPGVAPLPLILGCDASGVVEELGDQVKLYQKLGSKLPSLHSKKDTYGSKLPRFEQEQALPVKKGDRVFVVPLTSCDSCSFCHAGLSNYCKQMKIYGEHQNGTHSEYLCLPAASVIKFSDEVSFEMAAAFPLVFMTAWHMLVSNAQVKAHDKVLVIGAASGVGSAAIQIAKLFGAEVIATAGSQKKLDLAKNLGADFVINHYEESISKKVKELTNKQGVEIVIEHVGQSVWNECLKSLAMGGRLVTCGATTGPKVEIDLRHLFIKQQKIIGSTMGTKAELIEINKLIGQKKMTPVIAKVFPFEQVKEAHKYLEHSDHFGKVVLNWS